MDAPLRHSEPPAEIQHANPHPPLSLAAFVGFLASLMAINALATDIMLPGFPDIAASLRTDTTSVQATITAYMFGFGLSQLFMGFVADRYGRRPVMLSGLAIFTVASVFCATAQSLPMILAFRALQGFGAGGTRVVVGAAARDCYSGRKLARVMSLVLTIFMIAPVLAPAIGQAIILLSGWREIFGALVLYGAVMFTLCWKSFPETLRAGYRREIRPATIMNAMASLFGSGQTVGYTIAAGVFFGSLFGFIASAQQLLGDVYGLGVWFPLAFAVMALSLSVASFVNATLVERFGMRFISHCAVILFTLNSLAMVVLAHFSLLGAWSFILMHSINMLLVGLVFANFNALAMEPQGHIAGVASAFTGAATVIIGAGIGYFIGKAFDGTPVPLATGFFVSGAACLAVMLITEKGKLFQGRNA